MSRPVPQQGITAVGLALAAVILLTLSGCSKPADNSIVSQSPLEFLPGIAGDYFKLDSEIIGRPFHIFVRLPEGYEESEDSYPVVYVLDGDSLFPVLAPNHLFLNLDKQLPEAIIVGIAYGSFNPEINRRGFDFSEPAKDAKPGQGGAPDFLRFLETELIPATERRYRALPERRVLFGQNRGGHMVLYSAFTKPDLFWGAIASNLSLDPGRSRYFSAPAPANRKDLGLVVTSGTDDHPNLQQAALAWHNAWRERDDAVWDIHFATIEGGTHSAFSATSYRIGILWLFGRDAPGKMP